jgi:transposase-like protein
MVQVHLSFASKTDISEMKKSLKEISEKIQKLSRDDYNELMALLASISKEEKEESTYDFVLEVKSSEITRCPYCGKTHIVRNGHRKDGVQKFMCMDCRRSFVPTTNTIFSYSHKPLSVWKSYINEMISRNGLTESSRNCDMNIKTAFLWRHKILTSLCQMEDSVKLEGISEADETFFALSFKGNRMAFSDGEANRLPRKRGGGVHQRGLSKEQVCVPCAVDRYHKSVSKIASLGACSTEDLKRTLGNRFAEGATICSDGNSIYKGFADEYGIDLVQIKGGKKGFGLFHIQHLNSYHSFLKDFIRSFRGVSTKYLNGYLAWNNFINYAKEVRQEKMNILKVWLVRCGRHVTGKSVYSMQSIPCF